MIDLYEGLETARVSSSTSIIAADVILLLPQTNSNR